MADTPLQLIEDLRTEFAKATAVVAATDCPVTLDAEGNAFDEPEGTIIVKISHTLRKAIVDRCEAVLDAALADEPTGQAALDDAFERGREHGERSTDAFTTAITEAVKAIRLLKFDDAKTRARTAVGLLEDAARLVEALLPTPPEPTGGHVDTVPPPKVIKGDGWFIRATPAHDTFVRMILDRLALMAEHHVEPIVSTQVWVDVEADDTIEVVLHYRTWWLDENHRSLKMRSTFMLESWVALENSDPGATTVAAGAFEKAVRDMAESERQAACE